MLKNLNVCNLYLALWCLYYLQTIIYPDGGVLSLLIIVVILCISFYYALYLYFKKKLTPFLKILNILIVVLTIYGILLILCGDRIVLSSTGETVRNISYLKSIYLSLLPLYSFYAFSLKGFLTEKTIRNWLLFFLLVATYLFFETERRAIVEEALLSGKESEDITNNGSYIILSLLPAVVFYDKRPALRFLVLSFCVVLIFVSMKRGAILITLLCMPTLLHQYVFGLDIRKKLLLGLFFLILFFIAFNIVTNYMDNNMYVYQRVMDTMDGKSSGRDNIYDYFYNKFLNFDLQNFLFGIGANGTVKLYGKYAHNDWLEIAINQGCIGLFIYLAYWIALIRTWLKSRKHSLVSSSMKLVIIIYFLRSLFSMSYNDMTYFSTCVLGFCLANINNKKQVNIAR